MNCHFIVVKETWSDWKTFSRKRNEMTLCVQKLNFVFLWDCACEYRYPGRAKAVADTEERAHMAVSCLTWCWELAQFLCKNSEGS